MKKRDFSELMALWEAEAAARRPRGPPPDLSERKAMWEAREGDPSRLAKHLRAGIASPEETALAADLLEGKIRPRRPKLGAPTREQQDEMAFLVICLKTIYPHRKEMAIINQVSKAFGASERLVRYAERGFDPERRDEILQMLAYPEVAPLARKFIERELAQRNLAQRVARR